jgi:hypothetical protein
MLFINLIKYMIVVNFNSSKNFSNLHFLNYDIIFISLQIINNK